MLKIKVIDLKNNACAYFELGFMGGEKLFTEPGALQCLNFEVYQHDANFSFDEETSNYMILELI